MIDIKENEQLSIMNHSCAHLLAQAVKNLYPQALFWVGPVVSEGFYYDIDLGDTVIREEDLPSIEKEMKKLAKDGKRIVRKEITKEEALEMFKNDPYKIDLITRMDENENVISCYSQGDFIDLCRGPHLETLKELKHFKLLKVSGAYWKGDSNNKVLQRIYGICFENEKDLEEHLILLEEAKLRDHRKLGKELGIFMMSDLVGKGLPMYLPNGYTVWSLLEEYIKEKERAMDYQHVMTPPLGNIDLYKISGHLDHYKDDMFPIMERDGEAFVLRPMNCPHHMMIYKEGLHSYKDLPIRIGEIARDLRYEASGALKGIERSRCFCQNDAHLFVTIDQIKDEFEKVVQLILDVYKDFDITNYSFKLALRDPEDTEKYYQNDEMWDKAENMLRKVLEEIGIEYTEEIGDAAFYGPKLDVQVKPAVGNAYSLSTCQLDFCLPQKFELTYIDQDGSKQTPVVLHRAILGSLDRFIAYILEETKGALPLWLAPKQIAIVPVHHELHAEYANKVKELCLKEKFRVTLDDRNEKLGYRIREAQTQKVPVQLVLGDGEIENNSVTIRRFGSKDSLTVSIDEFVSLMREEIDSKAFYIK